VYKINENLEVTDNVVLTDNFPNSDNGITEMQLLKNDETYLLMVEGWGRNGYQLYYRLLNNDLSPKTDFITLANKQIRYSELEPILISEEFMMSWVDYDVSEGLLRSVLIDKSLK